MKVSSQKAITFIKLTLMALVGIAGFKTLNTIVEQKFPQFAKFTGIAELAAAFAGSVFGNQIVANISKGGALYAAMNILHNFVPADSGITKFIPQVSGLDGYNGEYRNLTLGQGEYDYANQYGPAQPNMIAS